MAGKKITSIWDDPNIPFHPESDPLTYASTGQPWHDYYTVLGMVLYRQEARWRYLARKRGITFEEINPNLAAICRECPSGLEREEEWIHRYLQPESAPAGSSVTEQEES